MGSPVAFGRDSVGRDGVGAYREQTERDGANELGDRDGASHDGQNSIGMRRSEKAPEAWGEEWAMRREKARRDEGAL